MILKPVLVIFYLTALLCTISSSDVRGQVVAIGHATAEVVESICTSSKAVTSFHLNVNVNTESTIKEAGNLNPATVNLGVITINSGKSVACNLVIQSAKLSDTKGNGFTIDTTMMIKGQPEPTQVEGPQTIQINGSAHILSGQISGLYKGTYTMVFAYN